MFSFVFILRLVTALTSLLGVYYGFKMFSLVKFDKYWSIGWGFFQLTLATSFFRRIYMLVADVPCQDLQLEITTFTSSLGIAIFVCLMHKFFVKYLRTNSKEPK